MSEKIRMVIGTGHVMAGKEIRIAYTFCPELNDIGIKPGTEIEVVALVEPEPKPEPKRELIRGSGEWFRSHVGHHVEQYDLITSYVGTIAEVWYSHETLGAGNKAVWGWATNNTTDELKGTYKDAKRAAEEDLAHKKLHGFRWK